MSGVVANCPGQAKVLKRGFDVQVSCTSKLLHMYALAGRFKPVLRHMLPASDKSVRIS